MRRFSRSPRPEPGPEINQRLLKYKELRVVGPDGKQLGIMSSRDALNQAREDGLDLVLVSSTASPPVCKIIDFGKHKYLEGKLGKDKKPKQQEVKGIKISPRIAEHDLAFLVRNASKFLIEGNKVRVTCQFRAREVTHPELGKQKLESFAARVADICTVERPPVMEGKLMTMILLPKPSTGVKKHAKDQDQQNGSEEVQDNRDGEDNSSTVAQQPSVPA